MSQKKNLSLQEKFNIFQTTSHKSFVQNSILRSRANFDFNIPIQENKAHQIIIELIRSRQFHLINDEILTRENILEFWKKINLDNFYLQEISCPVILDFCLNSFEKPVQNNLWLRVIINLLANLMSIDIRHCSIVLKNLSRVVFLFSQTPNFIIKHTILLLIGDLISLLKNDELIFIRDTFFNRFHCEILKCVNFHQQCQNQDLFFESVCYFYKIAFEKLQIAASFDEVKLKRRKKCFD